MVSNKTLHLSLTLIAIILIIQTPKSTSKPFNCTTNNDTTCNSLIDYISPNKTTISTIKTMFDVETLHTLLGANNLPLDTTPNYTIAAKQKITIPFPCRCGNGTGVSNRRPIYTVKKDDGLYHIAAEVFAGLVTYQEIKAVNNIKDENLIEVGQKLWIPLPCSCDEVDSMKVVHYGHVVEDGSSVEVIAQKFNTTMATLLRLNGMTDPKTLMAGAVLDVPLKACTSNINSTSLDYPLLVSNGTYTFTAKNCVLCKCNYANNMTLKCEPSPIELSSRSTCPSMQCTLGNTTSSGCNTTTCAYAGYTNQTILTTLATESTCPASDARSVGVSWNLVFISLQFAVLCLYNLL